MSLRPLCRSASPRAAPALAVGLALTCGGTAQVACRFLMPIGGGGQPVVEKRIGPDRLVGRTNWNTDFAVDRSFASYRVNFQSASTVQGTFPLGVLLMFTDGSNLQLVNYNLSLAPGQQRRLGPFSAVPG